MISKYLKQAVEYFRGPDYFLVDINSLQPREIALAKNKLDGLVHFSENMIKNLENNPLYVIPVEGRSYFIMNGNHRAYLAWKLGLKNIPAVNLSTESENKKFIDKILLELPTSGCGSVADFANGLRTSELAAAPVQVQFARAMGVKHPKDLENTIFEHVYDLKNDYSAKFNSWKRANGIITKTQQISL